MKNLILLAFLSLFISCDQSSKEASEEIVEVNEDTIAEKKVSTKSISKTVVGRARPTGGEGKASFDPFSSEGKYHSFPSGHTILSFTTLYALSKQFDNPFVKAGLIGVGMVSPVSRLWSGAHWLTDVGLSLAISVVVVDSIDKYLKNERNYGVQNPNKMSWKMQVGLGQVGIVGTF